MVNCIIGYDDAIDPDRWRQLRGCKLESLENELRWMILKAAKVTVSSV